MWETGAAPECLQAERIVTMLNSGSACSHCRNRVSQSLSRSWSRYSDVKMIGSTGVSICWEGGRQAQLSAEVEQLKKVKLLMWARASPPTL